MHAKLAVGGVPKLDGKTLQQSMHAEQRLGMPILDRAYLGATDLVKQQAQRALRFARELAEAVSALAREEGNGLRGSCRAGARQRARRQRLARARLAVEQDAPARVRMLFGVFKASSGQLV